MHKIIHFLYITGLAYSAFGMMSILLYSFDGILQTSDYELLFRSLTWSILSIFLVALAIIFIFKFRKLPLNIFIIAHAIYILIISWFLYNKFNLGYIFVDNPEGYIYGTDIWFLIISITCVIFILLGPLERLLMNK